MKSFVQLFLLFLTAFWVGCKGSGRFSEADYTVAIYTPAEASGFDFCAREGSRSTLVRVRNPWQGANQVEQRLLILRDEEELPAGFDGQVVDAPVQRVVCMSSSHVAQFDAVGQSQRICGVSGIDYLSNDYIRTHSQSGEVRDVGYDTNINFELLAALHPDLVMLYGVTGENTLITGKLRELGIPYIYVGDYMEESPLGKAEWLMLAAELCDCREHGEEVFGAIRARYRQLKELAAEASDHPSVMLNTPYRDTWFMPSSRSYMIRLLTDAGGRYIYTHNDSDSSVAVGLEEAYLLAGEADLWLNVGGCNTLAELVQQVPKFAQTPAVKQQQVWNNNRRQTPQGGSDFWESGVVHPDRVLADLLLILHPELTAKVAAETGSKETFYYQRLR